MSKKQVYFLLVLTLIVSLAGNMLLGRFLTAKISTIPLLNKWKLLSPQAPIVITNREVVRVSDSGDTVQAANTAKSKLSAVVSEIGNQTTLAGGAINLTSEGVFVSSIATFAAQGPNYFIALNDGQTAPITNLTEDAGTGLVFFRASAGNVPVADIASSKDLLPGDKILFMQNSAQTHTSRFMESYVTSAQSDVDRGVDDSDKPSRGFGAQPVSPLLPGQAVVNINGAVVGIWNGVTVISSDVLKDTLALYLQNPQKIIRPVFGFTYVYNTAPESAINSLPQGVLLQTVTKSKTATSTLEEGDIITAVDGNSVSENNSLEELLSRYKPGDAPVFAVTRNKQSLQVILKTPNQ